MKALRDSVARTLANAESGQLGSEPTSKAYDTADHILQIVGSYIIGEEAMKHVATRGNPKRTPSYNVCSRVSKDLDVLMKWLVSP